MLITPRLFHRAFYGILSLVDVVLFFPLSPSRLRNEHGRKRKLTFLSVYIFFFSRTGWLPLTRKDGARFQGFSFLTSLDDARKDDATINRRQKKK